MLRMSKTEIDINHIKLSSVVDVRCFAFATSSIREGAARSSSNADGGERGLMNMDERHVQLINSTAAILRKLLGIHEVTHNAYDACRTPNVSRESGRR
jgi:hypothetical protein